MMMAAENGRICDVCGNKDVPPEEESCPNCGSWIGIMEPGLEAEAPPDVQEALEPLSADLKMESEVSDFKRRQESSDSEYLAESEEVLPEVDDQAMTKGGSQEADELLTPSEASAPKGQPPPFPCPHCDQLHPQQARYCPQRGLPLPELSTCPHCGESVQSGWVACPNCGRSLDEEHIEETDLLKEEVERAPWQKKWSKYVAQGILILLLLSTVIGVVRLVRQGMQGYGPLAMMATASPTLSPFIADLPIAFSSAIDGIYDIYVIHANGSEVINLTDDPAEDWVPAWSPDGQWITYHSKRDGNWDLYVISAECVWSGDGCAPEPIRLTDDPADDAEPAWSPDGHYIAFRSNRDDNGEIYLLQMPDAGEDIVIDELELTRLTDDPAWDSDPDWSPDGSQIVFESTRDGNWEIYRMPFSGKNFPEEDDYPNVVRLTDDAGNNWAPAWSPDGRRIAFTTDRDGNNEIYVMDADGSQLVNLTNNPADDRMPTWSPDSQNIAFISNRDDNYEIYIMDEDGKNLVNVTRSPYDEYVPNCAPEGDTSLLEPATVAEDSTELKIDDRVLFLSGQIPNSEAD